MLISHNQADFPAKRTPQAMQGTLQFYLIKETLLLTVLKVPGLIEVFNSSLTKSLKILIGKAQEVYKYSMH